MQTFKLAPNHDVIAEEVAVTFTGGLECEVIILIKILPSHTIKNCQDLVIKT